MKSIGVVINATDLASAVFAKIAKSADGLDAQLADLSKRVATPEVDLKDAKFTAGMISAAKRIDKLSAAMATPGVDLEDPKFQAEMIKINAQLDRLDKRHVTATVEVKTDRSALDRLGGLIKGGGGIGGIAGTAAGALGIGAAIGPILVGLSQVTSALAAAGLGLGAFGALALPQFLAVKNVLSQVSLDTAAYERATTKAAQSTALQKIKKDWADISPAQRAAARGVQGLQAQFGKLSAKLAPLTWKVFNDGLKIASDLMPALLPFAKAAGNALDGLLKSLDKFTQTAGFKAFLAQLQALSGPAITALGKGLGQITISLGKLILVSASPNSIKVLSGLLTVLARTIDVITFVVGRASGKFVEWKNDFGDIGRVIGGFFKNLVRWQADVADWAVAVTADFRNFGHQVVAAFNWLSRQAGAAWNLLWKLTVSATVNGIATVTGWFRKLPGRVLGALFGLGHSLGAFMRSAWNEMWNAAKNVGASILHWVTSWASNLWHGLLHFFHIGSPSGLFYDIGKNLMLGLYHGIKDHVRHAAGAAQRAAGAVSGALGGDALANQALARKIFPWGADQWGPFVNLVMAESGFNRFARNPTSGAYGIAQALPPTKYPLAGQAAGGSHAGAQLSWMFNYIAQRYGTPAGAWAHELSAHWYDRGGWLPPGVTMAVNQTGRPERILSPGQGALVQFGDVNIYDATDTSLLAQRLSFAVTAAGLGS